MKTWLSLLVALLCGLAGVAPLHAQSTAFTYQGRLAANGSPANGFFDVRCSLFGAGTGGSTIGGPLTNSAVAVTNGLFTVSLNFGASVFTGADRWLDIAVRPAGGGTFTPLNPRQPITATPYALTALKVPGIDGHSLSAADGSPASAVFVNNDGSVGIGTTSPVAKLHVRAGANDAPTRLESTGPDSFAAGVDFYPGGEGKGYVGVPNSGAAFAPGELLLFGGSGVPVSLWAGQARALTARPNGNVGLGTDTPQSKLIAVVLGSEHPEPLHIALE